jgi:hypothetical protein
MAVPPGASAAEPIGGHYIVDLARPLPPVGGGAPAFVATDRRSGVADLMGLQVRRPLPARARPLQMLTTPIEGVLGPLAHGRGPDVAGEAAWFVITHQPPGPALSTVTQPWSEAALIDLVLRPAARALEQLRTRGVTHRGIRADNVFQSTPGQPVTLGPAWAAPPAMHQPAIYEPPYSAMCLPAGRGEGTSGDDVYALGVLLLILATGKLPLVGLDDAAVIRRKLELGSFAALVGDERLPPGIADLVSGMVAEDAEHRPPVRMLQDLAAARGRRVATRPPHRAQRALQIGSTAVWNVRMLAYAISTDPVHGLIAVCGAAVMPWLRRGLGETALAGRIEELLRMRAERGDSSDVNGDTQMLMLIVAILDPLAPLCWNTAILWPDGLGPAIAHAQAQSPAVLANIEALLTAEAFSSWSAMREERCDPLALRIEARQNRSLLQLRGPTGGLNRVSYSLNPLLPCASKAMAGRWIVHLGDIPAALEAVAAAGIPSEDPIDPHTAAFIAARLDRRLSMDINALNASQEEGRLIAQLRLVSELQQRFDPRPLPALAAWFASRAAPLVARWRSRTRRTAVAEQLTALAAAGQLIPMLVLIEDPNGHAADLEAAEQASAEMARIDAELASIEHGADRRAADAARLGQEIAAGIGLTVFATVLIVAALG